MLEWQDAVARCKGQADVIVTKQRRGTVGTAKLRFVPEFQFFSDQ